jgi:hypothetical protein
LFQRLIPFGCPQVEVLADSFGYVFKLVHDSLGFISNKMRL